MHVYSSHDKALGIYCLTVRDPPAETGVENGKTIVINVRPVLLYVLTFDQITSEYGVSYCLEDYYLPLGISLSQFSLWLESNGLDSGSTANLLWNLTHKSYLTSCISISPFLKWRLKYLTDSVILRGH